MLVGGEGPTGGGGIQLEGAGLVAAVIGGDEIGDIEGVDFTLISIREASEELVFGDGVGVVLTTAREAGLDAGERGSVVGACESDDEGGLIRSAVGVSDGVVDGEFEDFTVGEGLIGGVGWIEFPGAVGIDGEPIDGSTDQFVADLCCLVVNIISSELAVDDGVIFVGTLCAAESGNRCIVDRFNLDAVHTFDRHAAVAHLEAEIDGAVEVGRWGDFPFTIADVSTGGIGGIHRHNSQDVFINIAEGLQQLSIGQDVAAVFAAGLEGVDVN